MKAIQVPSFGPPEVLRLTELRDPGPGPGQVTIDVNQAAVGLIDVLRRQALYRDRPSPSQPPYVPRLEVAGTARALGEGVAGFEVGEPAVTVSANSVSGGYAPTYQQLGTADHSHAHRVFAQTMGYITGTAAMLQPHGDRSRLCLGAGGRHRVRRR